MNASEIEWIVIRVGAGRPIGAVGVIEERVAVVASFYDGRDGNQDGKVGAVEFVVGAISPFRMDGKAIAEVALAAKYDVDVLKRDPSFSAEANRLWFGFTSGLIADGMYAAWFNRGVSKVAGAVAGSLGGNPIKQFAIRKGMESAVKAAYRYAR